MEHEDGSPSLATQEQSRRGNLTVEDRSAAVGETVEERVVKAIQSVRKGEARSLTTSSADAIAPPELSPFLFQKLRASFGPTAGDLLGSGLIFSRQICMIGRCWPAGV
jgi:hypothetical protein